MSARARPSYTDEFKATVLKDAAVIGAAAASRKHKVDNTSVANWAKAAGVELPRFRTGKSGLSIEQKVAIVKRLLAGEKASDLAREAKVSDAAIYIWKQQYGAATGRALAPVEGRSSSKGKVVPIKPGSARISARGGKVEASPSDTMIAIKENMFWLEHGKRDLFDRIRSGQTNDLTTAEICLMNARAAMLKAR